MAWRPMVLALGVLTIATCASAQPSRGRSIGTKVLWTVIGASAGTAIGAYSAWDDDERAAVLQDRMRRRMIVGGSVGAAVGLWFGHRRSHNPPKPVISPKLPLPPPRWIRDSGLGIQDWGFRIRD